MRHYVSVDGGMSDNIRTALYDADYTVRARVAVLRRAAPVLAASSASTARAATSSCATAGSPATCAPGDLLAVAATGAYCRAMAWNYNAVPAARRRLRAGRPHASVVLRRETPEDLLALDAGLTP